MAKTRNGTLSVPIAYTDTSTAVEVGNLPANAIITAIKVAVGTAFDSGGADYIDIGTSATPAKYADNVDVSATGFATVTPLNVGAVQSATAPTLIQAIYIPAATSPSAGSGYVVVEYTQL